MSGKKLLSSHDKHLLSGSVLLIFVIILVNLAQAEEVTNAYNKLTLNANLELAEGKTLQNGVVLIVHGLLAHNKMEIVETTQQALLENGLNSLAINLGLGIDNRHGFYDCNNTVKDTHFSLYRNYWV